MGRKGGGEDNLGSVGHGVREERDTNVGVLLQSWG